MIESVDVAADLVADRSTSCEPDPARAEVYRSLQPIFTELYDALVPTFTSLRRLAPGLPVSSS